jgi:WhiB family redox-sensing transcriptional regulator
MTDISRLPKPVSETWEWQLEGACRNYDASTFFHPEGERGASRARREENAKAICASCPVLAACRAWAIDTQETYGIWGGLGEHEREAIFNHMSRQRRGLESIEPLVPLVPLPVAV